jgi:hypothetical protein
MPVLRQVNGGFGSFADTGALVCDVRFTPESGHCLRVYEYTPLTMRSHPNRAVSNQSFSACNARPVPTDGQCRLSCFWERVMCLKGHKPSNGASRLVL